MLSGHKLNRSFFILFLVLLSLQVSLSLKIDNIKPQYQIIDRPPNKIFSRVLALGDDEFLFRILTLRLQNSGDIFAGFAPLKNYNYKNLFDWMLLLDDVNSKSNVVPHLASYYYAQTQNKKDLIHIINYLEQHAERDFDNKWWWLAQSFMIAKKDYQDNNMALYFANKLANRSTDDMPLWVKQLPAFIYSDMGESCIAFSIIKNLMDDHNSGKRVLTSYEMEIMRHFIKDRLGKLKDEKFDPRKC